VNTTTTVIKKYYPAICLLLGFLGTLAVSHSCGDATLPGSSVVTTPTQADLQTEGALRDSIAAVLYAEIRVELEAEYAERPNGRPRVIRIPADTEYVAVQDSTLTDSLCMMRGLARDAIAIAKRAQSELQLLRGKADVLAVLDDTLCVTDAESVFTAHAEYSYRDAAFKNVLLSHTWIEEHKTLWDTLVAYAPYAAGALALIKTIVDLISPAP